MKKLVSLLMVIVMVFGAAAAFAATIGPEDDGYERLAGRTVNATVGEFNEDTKTFTVTVYDYDHFDEDEIPELSAGDTLLAGGCLYKVREIEKHNDLTVYHCEDGEEIYFEPAYYDEDDLIARSTFDDRFFMHVIAELHLPAAEGIILEDNSDPDLDAVPIITTGLEEILKVKADKEENSIGLNFYATTITLNSNLEIEKIHQDFDVSQ